jgi:hypothetical protein
MPGATPTALRPHRAVRRGGWVLALVMLWAQFVVAVHHHPESGDAPGHRVAACDLCIAQSTAAAPPLEAAGLPVPGPRAPVAERTTGRTPVLRDRTVAHAPRAPPPSRRA